MLSSLMPVITGLIPIITGFLLGLFSSFIIDWYKNNKVKKQKTRALKLIVEKAGLELSSIRAISLAGKNLISENKTSVHLNWLTPDNLSLLDDNVANWAYEVAHLINRIEEIRLLAYTFLGREDAVSVNRLASYQYAIDCYLTAFLEKLDNKPRELK
ncbi:MAG: hypothetical protein WCV63_05040 [Negativicutes bacterium]|jgi:hypothetical protein